MSARVDGRHDQKDVGEDGGRVDAEWNRGDIGATSAISEAASLPGVEEIAGEDGDGDTGHDAGGNKFDGKAAERCEADNQEKIGKAGEEQSEEAIDVARGEPRNARLREWLTPFHSTARSFAAICGMQWPCGRSA